MNCPTCGAENEADVRFCTECGTEIESQDVEDDDVDLTADDIDNEVTIIAAPDAIELTAEAVVVVSEVGPVEETPDAAATEDELQPVALEELPVEPSFEGNGNDLDGTADTEAGGTGSNKNLIIIGGILLLLGLCCCFCSVLLGALIAAEPGGIEDILREVTSRPINTLLFIAQSML